MAALEQALQAREAQARADLARMIAEAQKIGWGDSGSIAASVLARLSTAPTNFHQDPAATCKRLAQTMATCALGIALGVAAIALSTSYR